LQPGDTQEKVHDSDWPFNEEFMLAADPDIVRFPDIALPWDDAPQQSFFANDN
jgi:hypothetical protein